MSSATYLDKLLVDLHHDDCPVCVEKFLVLPDTPEEVVDESSARGIALLPCGHAYHNQCLKQWLGQANSCPVCRTKFNLVERLEKVGGKSPFLSSLVFIPLDSCTCKFLNWLAGLGVWQLPTFLPELRHAPTKLQFPHNPVADSLSIDILASTYEVSDKKQVADFDAAAWLEENPEEVEIEELEDHSCHVCENEDTQDIVIVCDGCEACYHPICVGLEVLPAGDWYCQECLNTSTETRTPLLPRWASGVPPSAGASRRPQRRVWQIGMAAISNGPELSPSERHRNTWHAWANVSNRIHAASGLELDFLDDDPSMANFRRLERRASEERRDLLQWAERLNSATRRMRGAGAASSRPNAAVQALSAPRASRGTGSRSNIASHQISTSGMTREATVTHRSRRTTPSREPSTPASPEQAMAWDDLDRAQNFLEPSTSGSRKRRAESPAEQAERQEPERKLKRPRTRAILDNAGSSSSSSSNQTPYRPTVQTSDEPSFLASLLREVESATGEDRFHWSPSVSVQETATSPSNYHLSPATSPSPVSSTYHTPRASSLTPPPQSTRRVPSAQSISSSSRSRSPPPRRNDTSTPNLEIRHPRPRRALSISRPRSQETSPIRAAMPIEAKESINRIVKSALGPHWRTSRLTKDQYADINRDVSRKMYEIVADEWANVERDRCAWERVAENEVEAAVRGLAV